MLCYPKWWAGVGVCLLLWEASALIRLSCKFIVSLRRRQIAGLLQVSREARPLTFTLPDARWQARAVHCPWQESCFSSRGRVSTGQSSQNVLADHALDTREADLVHNRPASDTTYLILGPGFEQSVLEAWPGHMLPQLLELTGLAVEDLVFWVQRNRFFRDRRTCPDSNATAIFIDAHALGRPLCCTVLPERQSDVWGLLRCIEVSLPDAVQPEWVGGAMCAAGQVGGPSCQVPQSFCGQDTEARCFSGS